MKGQYTKRKIDRTAPFSRDSTLDHEWPVVTKSLLADALSNGFDPATVRLDLHASMTALSALKRAEIETRACAFRHWGKHPRVKMRLAELAGEMKKLAERWPLTII